MKLTVKREVPGIQIHYADDQRCIGSKQLTLVESLDQGKTWRSVGSIATDPLNRLLLHHPIYARLMRGGILSALPLADEQGCVVVAKRKVFLIGANQEEPQELFQIQHGNRPLRRGLCVHQQSLYICDYWSNPQREPIHIHRINLQNRQAEIFYRFEANSIRHVHAIEPDPYSDQLWISTGDLDPECMVAQLDPQSKQLTMIGNGSQKWRAVSFALRPEAVYWGMDNHLGANEIWRYDRKSGQTVALGKVVGPVYYNACLDDVVVFGAAMELGQGEQDGYARLYAVDIQGNLQEVWKLKKDGWNSKFFGHGNYEFAEGRLRGNRFWVTTKSLQGGQVSLLFEVTQR